jgi:hypothetical protein
MDEHDDRLEAELALLESMYPEQVSFSSKAREVSYKSEHGGLMLRLPSGYLKYELPEVLSASAGHSDLRAQVKNRISESTVGEEVLDSIILAFDELASTTVDQAVEAFASGPRHSLQDQQVAQDPTTMIVWLHHLLNTNKRKQALSPPSASVCGVVKPGYPGVMIYSGPSDAVYEHVNELKSLNWQAFQVRHEETEAWSFTHGSGVKEVETMGELVAEIGEERKVAFMEAMRMK